MEDLPEDLLVEIFSRRPIQVEGSISSRLKKRLDPKLTARINEARAIRNQQLLEPYGISYQIILDGNIDALEAWYLTVPFSRYRLQNPFMFYSIAESKYWLDIIEWMRLMEIPVDYHYLADKAAEHDNVPLLEYIDKLGPTPHILMEERYSIAPRELHYMHLLESAYKSQRVIDWIQAKFPETNIADLVTRIKRKYK